MAMSSRTEISERRACRLVGLSRTVLHYEPKMNEPNLQLGERIGELAAVRRRFGYRRIHALLRREGSRLRFDDHPQLEKRFENMLVRVRLEHPGKDIGIEQVPLLPRSDASSDLRPADDQPLGGEDADGLAVSGTRHMMPLARRELSLQQLTGPDHAGDDLHTQVPGQLAVKAKGP